MIDNGTIIANIALSYVGCSEDDNINTYNDVIVRPADRVPALLGYYDRNPHLSTCALFAIGCLRLAGLDEPETTGTYFPGGSMRNAMVDLQTLARRHQAWVSASVPVYAPSKGDIWIISDSSGMNAHTGVCITSPAIFVLNSTPSWSMVTVEGGQAAPGGSSSAIASFSRTLHQVGNRWMLGSRYLLGYIRAAALPIPQGVT